MDWNDLRTFIAVCQEGSVSGAGELLGLSHTTVGRRMTALEAELGVRLFDRTRDGYSMTQSAEDILERALQMEEQALAIHRETDGKDQELRGRLVLTVPYDFAVSVLVPALPTFCDRYPAIDLELSTGLNIADLNARDADIALRLTAEAPEQLIGRKVLPLVLGVYASPDYLKACQTPQIIGYRRDQKVPEWAAAAFVGAQVKMRADSVVTVHAAIQQRMGIGRIPCFVGDSDPSLVRLEVEMAPSSWGVWVLHHADLRATARVRACREFLYETIEAQKALILGERSCYAKVPSRFRTG